jgi:hypothetical protein
MPVAITAAVNSRAYSDTELHPALRMSEPSRRFGAPAGAWVGRGAAVHEQLSADSETGNR